MGYKVAVVGATGSVGREMLSVLDESELPLDRVHAVASRRSMGVEVSFGEKRLKCQDLEQIDFSGIDLCLMSAGGEVARVWAPRIAAQGCLTIDNSSAWRYDEHVPLVVPEVNPDALSKARTRNIVANPNCSTIQLAVVLKPLHDVARVRRVIVATYQSVSGAGKRAMDELWNQTRAIFAAGKLIPSVFTKQIAFNVIPHIDHFMEDGSTREEWKMAVEMKKILDPTVQLKATCVRVPVFVGHSEAVNIEFERPINSQEARALLRDAPGCFLIDGRGNGRYATPLDSVGEHTTLISRVREDETAANALSLWCVADNLRKGAAVNAVQIAEACAARGLLPSR